MVVLPGVAYVQQPLAVVDGLAVVGLVQVMEHEPLQRAGVVGVARQQFLLRADVGGVFCAVPCPAMLRRNKMKTMCSNLIFMDS